MNIKEIKSYVIRTRMTPLQKFSYENLYSKYCIDFQSNYIDFKNLFPANINKIVVEIGFGMGDAIVELSVKNPDTGFIAIEVHKPGVGKLINELENKKLNNVKIIEYDAVKAISLMINNDSLTGIHIFFPDPWPKKKHHKRRLIKEDFINILTAKLIKGGYIYITTDWKDYADNILKILSNSDFLKNKFNGFASRIPWRPETKFERKGKLKYHNIYEVFFEKV